MAFFDEIGKKITKTSQEAYSKTKDLADVMKLNSAISDNEKFLAKKYEALGQLYYFKNADKIVSEEYQTLFSEISKILLDIDNYKEQIKILKGVKKCTVCGADMPSGATFCTNCGAKVVNTSIVVCNNCGKTIPAGAAFCTNCGAKVSHDVTPAPPVVEKRCAKCGAVLVSGSLFCTNCGTKIEEEQPAPVAPVQPEPATPVEPEPAAPVIDMPEPPQPKICVNCGAPLSADDIFCPNCFTKIDSVTEPIVSEPVAPVEPEPVAPVEPEPVAPVEPEPVVPVQPEPVAPVQPEPVAPVEPEPVAPVQPEPVFPDQPEPVAPVQTEPVAPVSNGFCKNCGAPLEEDALFCTNCGTRIE